MKRARSRLVTTGRTVITRLSYAMGYRDVRVRVSESLALVYFLYLTAVGLWRPARGRMLLAWGAPAAAAATVALAWAGPAVRDWAPAVAILVAYFLTGETFTTPNPAGEAWLGGWDRRLLGDPSRRFAAWPAAVVVGLHLVYMLCFLLIPAGFALLWWTGRAGAADQYWTTVVAAELGAFAPLPFFQTRPPWAVEPGPGARSGPRAIDRLSAMFVRRATIGANTFPSGHVAGSVAVALGVGVTMPLAGAWLMGTALLIALGCVVGRYHYLVDVVAGAALGVLAWAVVTPLVG
jgi:membrane-associated phospholipid phosphatase